MKRCAKCHKLKRIGSSFVADYAQALRKLELGDPNPMREVGKTILSIIAPNEGSSMPPNWFSALGTAKRNSLKTLYRDIQVFLGESTQSNPSLTSYWVRSVEPWGKALRTLELVLKSVEKSADLKVGPFKVVTLPGVTNTQIQNISEVLEATAEKLRKQYPELLYGEVYLSTHLKVNVSAHYTSANDALSVNVNSRRRFDDMYTMLHELGHRYDFKFLDQKTRQKFWDLSTKKTYRVYHYDKALRTKVADELVEASKARKENRPVGRLSNELMVWLRGPTVENVKKLTTDFLTGKLTEEQMHSMVMGSKDMELQSDEVLSEPLSVTPYGATSPRENWAEAFAHHILDMPMPEQFKPFFR